MRDFLQALTRRLEQLFGRDWPVYFGRIWQGEARPCFYLPPPSLLRRPLPCGRVRREIGLELHFYGDKPGWEQVEQAAEKLLRGLPELFGTCRNYRGRGLECDRVLAAGGREYLRLRARYVYYTTLALEAADGLSDMPEAAELMAYFAMKDKGE